MPINELGLPSFQELKSYKNTSVIDHWKEKSQEEFSYVRDKIINEDLFYYKMKYVTPESIEVLKKQPDYNKILKRDINATNKNIAKAINSYINIQNNFLLVSAKKAKEIATFDSLKSLIPIVGAVDVVGEKIKRNITGKNKPGYFHKQAMIGISKYFAELTEKFYDKGIAYIVEDYITKTNNLKEAFPNLATRLESMQEQTVLNFKRLGERNDKVFEAHLTNMLAAMKAYNKRLNTRMILKALTLGLK